MAVVLAATVAVEEAKEAADLVEVAEAAGSVADWAAGSEAAGLVVV